MVHRHNEQSATTTDRHMKITTPTIVKPINWMVVAEGVSKVDDEAQVVAVVHHRAGAEPLSILHLLHDFLQHKTRQSSTYTTKHFFTHHSSSRPSITSHQTNGTAIGKGDEAVFGSVSRHGNKTQYSV
ncbi:hypothetical protein E2C01_095542 [Portunus trituberculatus]|uniref:Uncharacterized protein n=1 Tax=Portunus trituberculatus TaxID=210409 RepID=A0A5B7JQ37_PORTR|nr:hypothetical protein [Portunus trituberculatus]